MKKITKAQFNALYNVSGSTSSFLGSEREWYASIDERFIGTVLFDTFINDYGFVLLERDEEDIYRCVDNNISFSTIEGSREALYSSARRNTIHPEHSCIEAKELFKIIVNKDTLHPHFKTLKDNHLYEGAKNCIKEIIYANNDLDGNYLKDFQTTGFNDRLWETFLFAFFKEQNFDIHTEHAAPDFKIEKSGETIFVEAVTVNQSKLFDTKKQSISEAEINKLNRHYMPIKFGSRLYSKLKREYWKKEHGQHIPLVIAIHDFHTDDSMCWSKKGLANYLYGLEHIVDSKTNKTKTRILKTHKYKTKKISSNYFSQPNAEYISAVLFTNTATLPKFNRMGKIAGLGSENVKMTRHGERHNPDPHALTGTPFKESVIVGEYTETWSESVIMYHNPHALYPLDLRNFENISHITVVDDTFIGTPVENNVLFSYTLFEL